MLNDVSWMLWGRKLKCYKHCCYIAEEKNLLKNDLTCWKLFLPFCDCYVKVSTISATESHPHYSEWEGKFYLKTKERKEENLKFSVMIYSFEFHNYFNCSHLLKSYYRVKPVMHVGTQALELSHSFLFYGCGEKVL